MVEKHDGADAVLRRCTVGGVCDGGVGGRAGWGAMVWQLSALSAEDCRSACAPRRMFAQAVGGSARSAALSCSSTSSVS